MEKLVSKKKKIFNLTVSLKKSPKLKIRTCEFLFFFVQRTLKNEKVNFNTFKKYQLFYFSNKFEN